MTKSVKFATLSLLSIVLVGMMMFSGCGSSSSSSSSTPPAATTYSGTLYMAGADGGHIGVFPVTIDPSNTTSPVTVNVASVTRYQLTGAPGSGTMFHDLRFGINADGTTNYNKIYYSGMMSRGTNSTVVDIGYVDLTTATPLVNNQGTNSTIDIDNTATGPLPNGADTIAFALSLIAPDEFGSGTRIDYCASGMNKDYYFPMSMSFPAYVDAIPVTKLATAGAHLVAGTDFKRTYIGQIDDSMNLSLWTGVTATIPLDITVPGVGNNLPLSILGVPPLAFIHGAASPDGTKIYMSTNQMAGLQKALNTAGFLRAYLVNASDLVSGGMTTAQVVSKASYTVAPSDSTTTGDLEGTIAYRASYTPDSQYILQSGSDRMLILKASDLSLYADTAGANNASPSGASAGKSSAIASGLGAGTFGGIEVHDVTATPDSKYAILAVRYFADVNQKNAGIKSSGVQLYDINNKAFVGKVTPTCGASGTTNSCHAAANDFQSRATCGVIGHLAAH